VFDPMMCKSPDGPLQDELLTLSRFGHASLDAYTCRAEAGLSRHFDLYGPRRTVVVCGGCLASESVEL